MLKAFGNNVDGLVLTMRCALSNLNLNHDAYSIASSSARRGGEGAS